MNKMNVFGEDQANILPSIKSTDHPSLPVKKCEWCGKDMHTDDECCSEVCKKEVEAERGELRLSQYGWE